MKDMPDWLRHARDHWTNRGDQRPGFAIEPGDGQESVWDYPRPPAFVADARSVRVEGPGGVIVAANRCVRVLETSHPPSYYLPADAVTEGSLVVAAGRSHCEWKGEAEYVALASGGGPVGWRYPNPYPEFAEWTNWVSFYPDRVACFVNGDRVTAQAGGFYGGWITDDVVGPFKGDPGTSGW